MVAARGGCAASAGREWAAVGAGARLASLTPPLSARRPRSPPSRCVHGVSVPDAGASHRPGRARRAAHAARSPANRDRGRRRRAGRRDPQWRIKLVVAIWAAGGGRRGRRTTAFGIRGSEADAANSSLPQRPNAARGRHHPPPRRRCVRPGRCGPETARGRRGGGARGFPPDKEVRPLLRRHGGHPVQRAPRPRQRLRRHPGRGRVGGGRGGVLSRGRSFDCGHRRHVQNRPPHQAHHSVRVEREGGGGGGRKGERARPRRSPPILAECRPPRSRR
mgnify:CR=1 FL=1